MRETAEFGKNRVVPADEDPSPDNLAELDFFEGMAHIFLGEHFRAAPLDSASAPVSPSRHYQEASSLLQEAIESGNGDQIAYRLAQARAYYNDGNLSEARSRAQEVLNMDDEYVRFVEYDNQNGPTNVMQDALYDRTTLDDFQPLPRLDFLDPKYGVSGAEEDPIPLLKAEEAHLILIEVRASPDDPFRSGLILDRAEETEVPGVSGTSVTESMVNNLGTMQEAWELYYLLRQEIFMAEGRRFVTFNLKLPLPRNERLLNPNVEETAPSIPDSIAGQPLDGYTWDQDVGEVTIEVNMNRVLANNRELFSPFLTRE